KKQEEKEEYIFYLLFLRRCSGWECYFNSPALRHFQNAGDINIHGILTTMYIRTLDKQLPENSFFLLGPRQVGKSTLLKKEKADLAIDLLDPELQLAYNKRPNLLRQQVDEIKPPATIFY
ncbi:MAG: hypothetical protein GY941_19535, partial [Planctomycetes bacterium]|nr:hypothetical protein [Planctomycetota bacterium]